MSHPVEEASDTDPRLDMLKTTLMQRYYPTDFESFRSFNTQKPIQPDQKSKALCNSLQVCLSSHIDINEHNYFFVNQFLLLLPPSTRVQCLASKLMDITELSAFTNKVHCSRQSRRWLPSTLSLTSTLSALLPSTATPPSTPPSGRNACASSTDAMGPKRNNVAEWDAQGPFLVPEPREMASGQTVQTETRSGCPDSSATSTTWTDHGSLLTLAPPPAVSHIPCCPTTNSQTSTTRLTTRTTCLQSTETTYKFTVPSSTQCNSMTSSTPIDSSSLPCLDLSLSGTSSVTTKLQLMPPLKQYSSPASAPHLYKMTDQ